MLKVAMVGIGDIAQKAYLPLLSKMEGVEILLCSRNVNVVALIAKKYKITRHTNHYKDIVNFKPDCVMVHTSTDSHFEIVRFFLSHNIPVFVDKPISNSYQNVEKLYELAVKKSTPLFVGFNRRYIPLFDKYARGLQQGVVDDLTGMTWIKNRFNLPGNLNTFIFDDFIHPLDSINIHNDIDINSIDFYHHMSSKLLNRLEVRWSVGNCVFHALMNRQFGITTESVQLDYVNKSLIFSSFTDGLLLKNEERHILKQEDWTPMLTSKGFDGMLIDWINIVTENKISSKMINRNLSTHKICQHIFEHVD